MAEADDAVMMLRNVSIIRGVSRRAQILRQAFFFMGLEVLSPEVPDGCGAEQRPQCFAFDPA
ncbi:MAG: hypothetical protein WCS84_12155 [Nocardioides sp.]